MHLAVWITEAITSMGGLWAAYWILRPPRVVDAIPWADEEGVDSELLAITPTGTDWRGLA